MPLNIIICIILQSTIAKIKYVNQSLLFPAADLNCASVLQTLIYVCFIFICRKGGYCVSYLQIRQAKNFDQKRGKEAVCVKKNLRLKMVRFIGHHPSLNRGITQKQKGGLLKPLLKQGNTKCVLVPVPADNRGFFVYSQKERPVSLDKYRLTGLLAGMAGIEPAMTESKSVALPLGYTPKGVIKIKASLKLAVLKNKWGG